MVMHGSWNHFEQTGDVHATLKIVFMRVTLVICLKNSCPTSRPSLQNRQGTQKKWSLYALRQVLWTIALGLRMSDKVASGFPTLWPPGVEGILEKLHGQSQGPCQRIFFAYFVFIPIKNARWKYYCLSKVGPACVNAPFWWHANSHPAMRSDATCQFNQHVVARRTRNVTSQPWSMVSRYHKHLCPIPP